MSGSATYPFTITSGDILRFVDRDYSISGGDSGEVLLDINAVPYCIDEILFPPPPSRIEWIDPSHSDGRDVSFNKYENREITVKMHVYGTDTDDLSLNIRNLWEQCLAAKPILEWQPTDWDEPLFADLVSPPIEIDPAGWFETFIRDYPKIKVLANLTLVFEAKSFLRGAREYLTVLENIAPNPSFEEWTSSGSPLTDTIDDWTITVAGASAVTKEAGTVLDGTYSVKMVRNAGACEITTTGFIPVDITEPYYLDAYLYSTAAVQVSISALCYNSVGGFLGSATFTGNTRGGTAWDKENIYLYQAGAANYYIRPTDWPALTTQVKLYISLGVNGTIYVDKLWFGSVKYISDYAADGVVGLRIPPEDIKGDLPALADFYISNPYTSSPWEEQGDETIGLISVSAVDANVVWAVGGGNPGLILYTIDAGITWTTQTSGTVWNLNSVSAVDANTAWTVGSYGTILYTVNAGATWTAQTSGTTKAFLGVSAVNANVAWAVGETGTILYTVNAGATWTAQTSGTTELLFGVSAVSANVAFAVGWNGVILHTVNAGATWTKTTISIFGWIPYFYGVSAFSANVAWAVGENGLILHTTDAGASWNVQTIGMTSQLFSVSAVDANTAFAVGSSGIILYTADTGTTWTIQTSGSIQSLRGVSAVSATVAWTVGGNGTILYGVYPVDALSITDLILGERNGYSPLYNPVKETPALNVNGDALTLAYSPYRHWGSYRIMASADNDHGIDYLFNLASHSTGRYMVTAGIAYSANPGANDSATIHLLLQLTDGTVITTQYIEDAIDTAIADTDWKEVALLTPNWDVRNVSSHVVSDDAVLGNINQVVEIIPNPSVAVDYYIDYVAIIPVEHWVKVDTITSNYLIIDSTLGYCMDSIDGGPSTAQAHDPTLTIGVPDFLARPEGMNLTLVAIEEDSGDQKVGMVNIEMQYDPLFLLVSEG